MYMELTGYSNLPKTHTIMYLSTYYATSYLRLRRVSMAW